MKHHLLGILLLSASVTGFAADNSGLKKVNDVFTVLPSQSVELKGSLSTDVDKCIQHWQKETVPYADMVQFFRTGRPQFAVGEMWGKAVRSGAMFYRYRHDEELKNILSKAVDDLLSTTRSNGSISCDEPSKQPGNEGGDMWERKYVLLGLSQYYRQVEQSPRVLEAMEKEAKSIMDQVGEGPGKMSITELGWSPNKIESSCLLEPFMRLYFLTGKKEYFDYATYIVDNGGCHGSNMFEEAYNNVWARAMGNYYPKAYEMMSVFEGFAEYYRATGNPKYLTALTNFFKNIAAREITITGNGGGDAPYFPQWLGEAWTDTYYEQTNPKMTRMMETCVGVTWLKYCSQILRLTGDPATVDMIEKYLYNGLLGAMTPNGDGFSYVNMLNGQKVTNEGFCWNFNGVPVTCCNLNGPMGLAYVPVVSVMQSKEGPVVNLYTAQEVDAAAPSGQKVHLSVQTEFPKNGAVKIKVTPKSKETFTIRVRIPAWSATTTVAVNGKPVSGVEVGKYLELNREWSKNDEITLSLDMTAHIVKAPGGWDPAGDNFRAVTYGPIVLCRDENIDAHYADSIDLVGNNGVIELKAVKPTQKSTRMEFEVPTTDGPIRMIDYASMNGWEGKKICTWLPMKTLPKKY